MIKETEFKLMDEDQISLELIEAQYALKKQKISQMQKACLYWLVV